MSLLQLHPARLSVGLCVQIDRRVPPLLATPACTSLSAVHFVVGADIKQDDFPGSETENKHDAVFVGETGSMFTLVVTL